MSSHRSQPNHDTVQATSHEARHDPEVDSPTNEQSSGVGTWEIVLFIAVLAALIVNLVGIFSSNDLFRKLGFIIALWAAFMGAFMLTRVRARVREAHRELETQQDYYEEKLDKEKYDHRMECLELEQDYMDALRNERDEALLALQEQLDYMQEQLESLTHQYYYEPATLRASAERMQELETKDADSAPSRYGVDEFMQRSSDAGRDATEQETHRHRSDQESPYGEEKTRLEWRVDDDVTVDAEEEEETPVAFTADAAGSAGGSHAHNEELRDRPQPHGEAWKPSASSASPSENPTPGWRSPWDSVSWTPSSSDVPAAEKHDSPFTSRRHEPDSEPEPHTTPRFDPIRTATHQTTAYPTAQPEPASESQPTPETGWYSRSRFGAVGDADSRAGYGASVKKNTDDTPDPTPHEPSWQRPQQEEENRGRRRADERAGGVSVADLLKNFKDAGR